ALGAAISVSWTSRFGVSLLRRNGYSLYALYVRPPPQGFSHASFSSNTTTFIPARARRSAAKDPAGPPPKTATVFIVQIRSLFRPYGRMIRRESAGRRGRCAVRVDAVFRAAADHPFTAFSIQRVTHHHRAAAVAGFGPERDGRAGLVLL